MAKSKLSQEEYLKERQKLDALIEKRREAGLQAVEEMSKHPLSLERIKEIAQSAKAARTKP